MHLIARSYRGWSGTKQEFTGLSSSITAQGDHLEGISVILDWLLGLAVPIPAKSTMRHAK
jgi:hypothetical protein